MKNQNEKAFSLIEIMVTVTLLAVIIVGLVAAFNTTQRAMAYGINQSDALASGRVAGDMLSRELEQMTVAPRTNGFNFGVTNLLTNTWPLNATDTRTNAWDAVLFWEGDAKGGRLLGYSPGGVDANGVHSLWHKDGTNMNQILDGVVSFTVRGLDRNGTPLTNGVLTNSLPVAVQVELAVLETRTLAQYQALSNNPAVAGQFLTNQAGHLHVFRQRIIIPTTESSGL